MFANVFGRYAARAPGALPQLRTFSSRLGSTTQMLSTNPSTSSNATAPTPFSSTLSSAHRSLHTSLSVWEAYARRTATSKFSRKDPAEPPQPSQHLFIKSLPRDATEAEIRDFIREVSGVEEFTLRLLRSSEGEFIGSVFLDLASVEEAQTVKSRLIRADHDMGKIWVAFSSGPKKPDIMNEPTTSIFVGLAEGVSETAFRETLLKVPGVEEVRFGYSGKDLAVRAFVDFASIEDATAAVKALQDSSVESTSVTRCNFARPRKDIERQPVTPTDRLYIRDVLSTDIAEELKVIFEGKEGFKSLFVSPIGSWALAYFHSVEHAAVAFEAVRDLRLKSSDRPVKIKYGTSRTEPQNALENEL